MKFKITTMKAYEMEIEDTSSLAALYQWSKTHCIADWGDYPVSLAEKAAKEVEKIAGFPFGCKDVPEAICAVFAENDDVILEW